MTYQEFSELFDVLYNNITSNQGVGLNEYEKSVFLTKAQDELLKNYFNPGGNKYEEGFDGNPKRQIDFSMLMTVFDIGSEGYSCTVGGAYDKRGNGVYLISLPSEAMMIVNETVDVTRKNETVTLNVTPISFDEYSRLMSKPFKRPLKYQAWRLITYDTANMADLIVGENDTLPFYTARYIRKPKPIIVGDTDGLTIGGFLFGTGTGLTQGCELSPTIHEEILQRAVELAKVTWLENGNDNLEAVLKTGQRSE